jgi:hypothetical protein
MNESEQQTESALKAAGKNAPRLQPQDIDGVIVGESYVVLPSGRTTICELTLANGFTVRGESSCVSIENFDLEIGRKLAREKAREQIWQLEGYRLAETLHSFRNGPAPVFDGDTALDDALAEIKSGPSVRIDINPSLKDSEAKEQPTPADRAPSHNIDEILAAPHRGPMVRIVLHPVNEPATFTPMSVEEIEKIVEESSAALENQDASNQAELYAEQSGLLPTPSLRVTVGAADHAFYRSFLVRWMVVMAQKGVEFAMTREFHDSLISALFTQPEWIKPLHGLCYFNDCTVTTFAIIPDSKSDQCIAIRNGSIVSRWGSKGPVNPVVDTDPKIPISHHDERMLKAMHNVDSRRKLVTALDADMAKSCHETNRLSALTTDLKKDIQIKDKEIEKLKADLSSANGRIVKAQGDLQDAKTEIAILKQSTGHIPLHLLDEILSHEGKPSRFISPVSTEARDRLLRFYGVETERQLIMALELHINQLLKYKPANNPMHPQAPAPRAG